MAELTSKSSPDVFGTKAGFNSCKLESAQDSTGVSPLCPQCSSKKVWRDGTRSLMFGEPIQRWLCRDCGLRFSDPDNARRAKEAVETVEIIETKSLKAPDDKVFTRQICAKGAKNLTATETKTVAGDTNTKRKTGFPFAIIRNIDLIPEEPRGLLIQFMAYLEREGYCADIQYPATLAHLVRDGANLHDPESVKTIIARQKKKSGDPWSNSMKMLATCAYDAFCEMRGLVWKRPTYVQDEAKIYVPDESELDALILGAPRKKMAAFLWTLKRTFADPEEAIRIEWIDLKENIVRINHPVKGHYCDQYDLPIQLCGMLNSLPHKNKRIFATNYNNLYASFVVLRARTAEKLHNPNILQITFKSFRHWGGTMLAYYTRGNVPEMARVLRHKNWKSTQKYVHLAKIPLKDEDCDTVAATTSEEILALGKACWIKYDEAVFNGVTYHYYRKPKRFGSDSNALENMVHKSENSVDRFLCSSEVSKVSPTYIK